MKKFILTNIVLFYFISFCYPQESTEKADKVSINLHPSKGVEMKLNKRLIVKTSFALLRENLFIAESNPYLNDTVKRQVDTLKITLNSGTSWNLLSTPPEKSAFLLLKVLFKSESEKVKNRVNYLEFLSHFEDRNEIPYEMIEKINICEILMNKNSEKWLYVTYEIKPNSLNELIISNREIQFDKFGILENRAILQPSDKIE